ncbi:MAG: cadherin domain-containing protein, partial [Planctomycetaceae bacterium]|nr:cadherin domain-containing protein [Planctomycetaceae bacterium]
RALTADEIAALATDQSELNDAVAMTVATVNDAPVLSALDGNPTFTEGGTAVVLDGDVTIYDVELSTADNFSGATLTIVRNGGANAQDVYSATGTLGSLTEGGSLIVGATTIGTVTTNSGGTLMLSFNGNATNALVNSAMQQIAYANSSDVPPATVQLDWTFDDGNSGVQGSGGAQQAVGSTTVNITATNDDPVITSNLGGATATISVAENTTAVTTVTSTDVDGGTPVYSISGGADAAKFSINSSTGVLTFVSLPDFETPNDSGEDNVYDVQVTVSDGNGGTDRQDIAVTVTDLNDAPVLDATGSMHLTDVVVNSTNPAGNSVAAIILSGGDDRITDQDAGAVEGIAVIGVDNTNGTWQYSTNGGSSWQSFGVVSNGSAVLLNAEAKIRFVPNASYTGSAGDITFRAWDQTSGSNGQVAVDTSSNGDGFAFSVSTETATLTVIATATTAVDDAATTTVDTPIVIDVTVNDTDPESDPITVLDFVNPTNGSVTDNFDGTVTYTPNASYTGADSFDYLITDGTDDLVHYWRLDGDATDLIGTADGAVNGTTTIEGRFGDALAFNETSDYVVLPDITYGAELSISLMFKVDDLSGTSYQYLYSHGVFNTANSISVFLGETGGPGPSLYTRVLDGNDSPPSTTSFDINGIIGDGQWHTYTLTASATDGLKVYLDGVLKMADSNRATDGIDPAGNVYLGARQDLDATRFFGGSMDSVAIYASALNATQVAAIHSPSETLGTVSVTVEPNAAPVITSDGGGATAAINVAENTTAVTTVTATDANLPAPTLTFSISGGADAAKFTINSSTGALTFVTAPDCETPTDSGADNVYNIQVTVSDGNGGTDLQDIAVTVTDVDEFDVSAPTDTDATANAVDENAANGTTVGITGFATDDDATTNVVTYSLTDDAGGRFAINSGTGVVTVANGMLLDREANASHNITVRATSADGSTNDTVFTINVNDVDEFDVGAV